MKIKDIFIGFILIISIFFSYYSLKPLSKIKPLTKNYYSLESHNIGGKNKWSAFKDEGGGTFFIHPGKKNPSIGIFTFKRSNTLFLNFWINEVSKAGDIEFTIYKNAERIKTLSVAAKNHKHVSLQLTIEQGDKLKIMADKHGTTCCDWGQLRILEQNNLIALENFLIPFLWAILFIFLLGKRYKYIAIVSYSLFASIVFAEKLNFGYMTFQNLFTYTIFIFTLTFTFICIYQMLRKIKSFKIATIFSFSVAFFVYIIPALFIIYTLNFDKKITNDILFAVFQSNYGESYEYISDYISTAYIILFILFSVIIGYLLSRQEKKETVKIEKSLLIFIVITFFSIFLTHFSHLRLPNFIISSFEEYNKELKRFKQVQEKRKTGQIKFHATKKSKGETYIFIIGESLNKRHMGLYGYLRNTTPKLSEMAKKGELTIFKNTYSSHTHTIPVLSLALTEANQYNKKSYYDSLSIIDVLKKADVETYWLTNQKIYGIWDNAVSVIGTSADHLIATNKYIGELTRAHYLDGVLVDKIKKVLSIKTDKDRVIFVHLIGNHGKYTSRYPHDTYGHL